MERRQLTERCDGHLRMARTSAEEARAAVKISKLRVGLRSPGPVVRLLAKTILSCLWDAASADVEDIVRRSFAWR